MTFINIKYRDVAVEVVPSRSEQHASGIQKLIDREDKCLNELGRYVENETLMFNI